MTVTVIIVSFNTCELLRDCLRSLLEEPGARPLEIFVVDNDSADGSADMVRTEFAQVSLIPNTVNVGFAAANNQAFEQSTGDYIFLVNPDAAVQAGSIDHAVEFLENHDDCALCGGKIVSPDGHLEPSARRFPTAWRNFAILSGLSDRYPNCRMFGGADYKHFDHETAIDVDWVPGTFTAIRRSVLEELGFFDERFYLYYEETDLCLRVRRAGKTVFFIPSAQVDHVGGACSQTRDDLEYDEGGAQLLKFRFRSEYLYFRKNHGIGSVLANAWVELAWHMLRWTVNLRPGPERRAKRRESASIVKHGFAALRDTRFGTTCPPTPW